MTINHLISVELDCEINKNIGFNYYFFLYTKDGNIDNAQV